jgi:hypothetical protein
MSSRAPASTVSPASSTKPIWAPPRRSPRWSKTVPPPSRSPPPPETSDCPALSGWRPARPASWPCSNRSGRRPAPGPRRQRLGAHLHPSLQMAGAGVGHYAGLIAMGAHGIQHGWRSLVQIHENVAGAIGKGLGLKVHIVSVTLARAQKFYDGFPTKLSRNPQPGARPGNFCGCDGESSGRGSAPTAWPRVGGEWLRAKATIRDPK